MKTIFNFILFTLLVSQAFSQNASTFFPSQTGYKWYFESIPLDSLNNPVDSLKFYSIDSFAVVDQFNGRTSNIVLSKSGPQNTIYFQPFLDSLHYSFQQSDGYEYFDPLAAARFLSNIDSTFNFNFLNFFNSLRGWYPYYKFASTLNQSYQIFKKDTTVTIDSTSLPVRFELLGKRLSDETINSVLGNFLCKKFLLERRLSYLVNIPPFPPLAIKILGVEENLWISSDNWVLKRYVPSTNVDLSILGFPSFSVPGLETNITNPITGFENNKQVLTNFKLYQNFPNPFNPACKIIFAIPDKQKVSLKVYDILGRELAVLINDELLPGKYEVDFSGKELSSGIYIYQLNAGEYTEAKKMTFLK